MLRLKPVYSETPLPSPSTVSCWLWLKLAVSAPPVKVLAPNRSVFHWPKEPNCWLAMNSSLSGRRVTILTEPASASGAIRLLPAPREMSMRSIPPRFTLSRP